jgi:hypothetical protein
MVDVADGLTPISPAIRDGGTLVIAAPARTVKLPAVPRSTGSIAFAGVVKLKNKRLDNMQKTARGNRMLFTGFFTSE